jgi:hypothetical protein
VIEVPGPRAPVDRVSAVLPSSASRPPSGARRDAAVPGVVLGRRSVLITALGLGTGACTPYRLGDARRRARQSASPEPQEETRADPDVALAAEVLVAEQALLDRIDATVARHPRLEQLLTAVRESHAAHIALLSDAVPDDARSAAASPTPSPAADPLAPSPAPSHDADEAGSDALRVPRDADRAVRVIAHDEDELGRANRTSAFTAESGSFARVLSSMAAAAAQQSVALSAAPVRGGRR